MSQNALARFMMSEKDTRPYWETDHRGMVMPLVKSGYNNSVSYGVPGILGGSAWGTLNDIIEGRQVTKGEIEQGASDAAGAAITGSLAMTRPSGSIGSGGRPEAPGIRAYHGSPHDFDKFSLDKIGTGEGAQAYGHGLYFAENEAIAKFYRNSLGGATIDGAPADFLSRDAQKMLGHYRGDAAAAHAETMAIARQRPGRSSDPTNEAGKYWASVADELQALIGKDIKPSGRLYEVNIKADPNDFLDWDQPLSQQSEKVRAFLDERVRGASGMVDRKLEGDPSGQQVWEAMRNPFVAKKAGFENFSTNGPSNGLREAGIPGIRYLDQGSRTAGEGSRNYVVFDDNLVEILRKYGLAGLSMLGGAAATGNDARADQPAPLRASDDGAYDDFMKMLGLVNNMGQGYQPDPVQSDYVQDRRNEDPGGVYQSDRVAFRRRMPNADGIPPELRFLLPRQ